jgi:peroxiredoxin
MATQNLPVRTTPIGVGEVAPDFTLLDQDRQEWKLSAALKKGRVVVCFYPLDFSPVCSTEMKCVTDELGRFAGKHAEVVGVSCDSFFTHKAWADSMGLKHRLLADMHREVCKAYGFYFPDLNVAARGTVVIGTNGKVEWVQARELKNAMNLNEILAGIS